MKKNYSMVVVILALLVLAGCEQKREEHLPLETINATFEEVEPSMAMEETLKSSAAPVERSTMSEGMTDTTSAITTPDPMSESLDHTIHEKPTDEQIQQALKNAGLYAGEIDGKIGPKSKKAIRDFQAQNGLTVDGKVGPKTWEKLGIYLNQTSVVIPTAESTASESSY